MLLSVFRVWLMRCLASLVLMICRSRAVMVLQIYAPMLVGEVYNALTPCSLMLSAGRPLGKVMSTKDCQVSTAYWVRVACSDVVKVED